MPLTFGTLGSSGSETQPSFIGATSATVSSINSAINVTLPTFQTGDLIFLALTRTGTTLVPTLPSGYTSIYGAADTFFFSYQHAIRLCYRIADGSTPSTFLANRATRYGSAVWRNASAIGSISTSAIANNNLSYPSLILSDAPGWVVGVFCNYYSTVTASDIPAGQTSRVAANAIGIWDTNSNVNSYAGQNASTNAQFSRTFALELK